MKKVWLLLISLFCCGKLYAASIDEIVFFGDSLTDNGNLYNLLKFIPKTPPYFNGRFANGPVWSEIVGEHYQKQSNIPYSIYAYGGATALSTDQGGTFFSTMSLDLEIYQYYLSSLFADRSRTLFVFWIGSNDYLQEDNDDGEVLTTAVVNQIITSMNSLINDGAQYFYILNVPNLSVPPLAALHDRKDRLKYLSGLHNEKLEQRLKELRRDHPNVRIMSLNAYHFLDDLIANTDRYNQEYQLHLSNKKGYCWQGGIFLRNNRLSKHTSVRTELDAVLRSPALSAAYQPATTLGEEGELCEDSDSYVFWDPVHPSGVVHQLLAQIVIKALDNEAKDLF